MIHKDGLLGQRKMRELPHNALSDSGMHYVETNIAPSDMKFVEEWATKKFLCWYCNIQPVPHSAKVLEFELEKGAEYSHAVDVCYRCAKCGLQYIFGLPITKEEYEKVEQVGDRVLYA